MAYDSNGLFTSFLTVNARNQIDRNRNGLERNEIAQGALSYRRSQDPTDQKIASLLATISVGGRDGNGYFNEIDTDRNNILSFNELNNFAALDGNQNEFSSEDVRRLNPSRFVEGGVTVDENRLQQIANGNNPNTPSNNGFPSQIFQLLSLFLQLFTQLLGGNNGGVNPPPRYL